MFQTILFNAIVCIDYHTAEKLDHFLIKEIEHKAILCITTGNINIYVYIYIIFVDCEVCTFKVN